MKTNGHRSLVVCAALVVGICGCESAAEESPVGLPPPSPAASTAASVEIVSGNGQLGRAGKELVEPLQIRVTDAGGHGVGGVEVTWSVASGQGAFVTDRGGYDTFLSTRTTSDGRTGVAFMPVWIGTTMVAAEVAGLPGQAIVFEAEAAGPLLITFWGGWEVFSVAGFADVTVPVGETVEWVTDSLWTADAWSVTSNATPPGGAPFDSGVLTTDGWFQFVPDAAGTWEYFDQVSGATGTITAR